LRIGQVGLFAVILSSNGSTMTGADLTLRFNPNVIKITSVKDGGMLSSTGPSEFNHSVTGDSVNIHLSRTVGGNPVSASGQLVLVYYQAIGEGPAELTMGEIQLYGPNGVNPPVNVINGNIEVIGNGQPGQGQPNNNNPNPGNGTNNDDDDDDDEDDEE
jgi:hypothetical protein